MSNNPLQQYFRQPKVFITLPSHGVYNKPGTFTGPIENMPIFGMTGMDEILLKTPDALLTGESTVKVIQSCCPNIADGWDVSNLDIDAILVAIRIATAGNTMGITHTCSKCGSENEYDINVSAFLDHFATCKFDSRVVLGNLTVKLIPLSYRQVTDFNLENFTLQKRLFQVLDITDDEEKNKLLAELYQDLATLQNKIFTASIEQIEIEDKIVTEKPYIREWIDNSDKAVFDQLKEHIDANNKTWKIPESPVKCDNCGADDSIQLDMDQSSFFASA